MLWCVLADQAIDLRHPVAGDAKKIVGKTAHFLLDVRPLRPESFADNIRRLLAHVCLEEHLQNQFAGFAASAHFSRQPSAFSRQ